MNYNLPLNAFLAIGALILNGCCTPNGKASAKAFEPKFAFVLLYDKYEDGTLSFSKYKIRALKEQAEVQKLASFFPNLATGGNPMSVSAGWMPEARIWFVGTDGESMELEIVFGADVWREVGGVDCKRQPGFEEYLRDVFKNKRTP